MDRRGFVGIMVVAAAGLMLGLRLARKAGASGNGFREAMHYKRL